MNTSGRTLKKLSLALAASSLLAAGSAFAQQASLNLDGSSMSYCNTENNLWEVTKQADQGSVVSGSTVTWTINATKNPGDIPAAMVFCVEGTLKISNGGSVEATVGNIVVNVQKHLPVSGKLRWVSASANVADKTNRNLATSGNVVAQASSENAGWNAAYNSPATYGVSLAGVGTFSENSASGDIVFMDADWTDLTSNGYVIPANGYVELNYKATFNATELMSVAHGGPVSHLRTEVLVTFGNAGGRGGSGASLASVNINGNTTLDADESNVRTVPVRASLAVPPLEVCNPFVTLTDTMEATGVTVSVDGGTTFPSVEGVLGTAQPTDTTTYLIVTKLDGEGSVTNTVTMVGQDTDCCEAASGSASATVIVTTENCLPTDPTCNPGGCQCGEDPNSGRCLPCTASFCTYSQGGFSGPGTPGQIFNTNYQSLFGEGGLMVGTYGGEDGFGIQWTGDDVGQDALKQAVNGGGPAGPVAEDMLNPNGFKAKGGGSLGHQTAALTLNIAFGGAGLLTPGGTGFGGATFCAINSNLVGVCPAANTMTVNEFLALANSVLGGGEVPAGQTYSSLAGIAEKLNVSFHGGACSPSSWASANFVGASN